MAPEKKTPEGNIYDLMRKSAGIDGFTTTTPPIGGRIKENIADFIVQEIMPNGDVLSTRETYNPDIPFGNRNRVTRFTLIKKNTDTIYAAEVLRDYLKVSMGFIKWAGIKDHTAITSQRFSVRGNHMEKLKRFKHPHITITHILPSRDNIDLGKLWGNKFTINLRHTSSPYSELLPDLTEWKQQIDTRGFPNFFGMQRFGQHRPNSHITGKLIFEKKYREAVEEFLFTVYPLEYEPVAQFRKDLSEDVHNPNIRSRIPHGLYYEKKMLEVLDQYPNDYKRILLALPNSLINLILSSYQSYLFNTLVSHRLKVQDSLIHPVKGDTVSILKGHRGHPSLIFYKYDGGEGWNDDNILKAFKHDRASIVAPIIGFKTNLDDYPYFKPLYSELLEKEGFTINQFLHDIPGLFFFEGTFRAICNRPSDLQVSQAHIINKFPELDPNGIKLEFSLPKGTYATMVLAELRKHSSI
ncbi:MAG: tRNA pseudouridine(13) synthase TruD [Promethearchaeota archaeon]